MQERSRKSRRIGSKQDLELRGRLKDGAAVRGVAEAELLSQPLDVLTPAELARLCLHVRWLPNTRPAKLASQSALECC